MRIFFITTLFLALLTSLPCYSKKDSPRRPKLQIKQFTKLTKLDFFVDTNVPGFNFQGRLKKPLPITINKGKFAIPHRQLTTEMDLRDRHMYEKIFKGQDISFEGAAKCRKFKRVKCKIVGKLGIAGKQKKQVFIATKSGKHFVFTHLLKLSDFGIEKPDFKGVEVRNEIKITARIR